MAICLSALSAAGCSSSGKSEHSGWNPEYDFDVPYTDYVQVDRDGDTTLYVNPSTMDIRLEKGETVWESRPFTNESTDNTNTAYNSLFVVNAGLIGGNDVVLDSWVDCISKGQYKVEIADGKLTAKFVVGEMTTRYLVPDIMREKQFEELILNHLTDSQRRKTELRYTLYTPEIAAEDNMLDQYPMLEKENMYVLNGGVSDREKEMLSEYFSEAGFTEEQLDKEYEEIKYTEDAAESSPVFQIPLKLYLDNGDFIAEVPASEIYYDTDKYLLKKLDLLKNLTATEKEQANQIFLPDGSGAIIDLKKDSYRLGRITKKIYSSLGYVDNVYGNETANLPVFGFSRNNAALFAIIEEGEALSEVTADYSGAVKSLYPVFVHQESETESVSDGWKYVEISNYNETLPDCLYKVRYRILNDDISYNGMAKSYRDYLKEKGMLNNKSDSTLPFYLETLGSVNVNERVLLFPVNHEVALTTFEQDMELLDKLAEAGITSPYLRLTGAVNGGMMNSLNKKLKLCNVLGGKNGFSELLEYAEKSNAKVFLNAEFTRVYKDNWFDGFRPQNNATKKLNDQYYNASTMNMATEEIIEKSFAYCLNPGDLKKNAEQFLKQSQKLGVSTLSVGAIGENILENYDDNQTFNRYQTQKAFAEMLAAVSDKNDVMVSGANAYVFPYADHILNLPVSSSEYMDYAQTVPFLQMVLHGHINYAVEALNMTNDYQTSLLKAIETGSGIHFVVSAQNINKLRSTAFSYYLATDQSYWLPIAIESYQKAAEVLGDVSDKEITGHYKLASDVYLTVYEGGKQIVTNYNKEAVSLGGVTVAAKSYQVVSFSVEEISAMGKSA